MTQNPKTGRDAAARRAVQRRAEKNAAIAWQRGQEALRLGDPAAALRWLDRACRLAPRDPTLRLARATAWLSHDAARAEAEFSALTTQHDVRDAWLGLAAARLRNGLQVGRADEKILGSPIDLANHRRLEGVVGWDGTALTGWAWHPANPARDPVLIIHPARGRDRLLVLTDVSDDAPPGLLAQHPGTVLPPQDGSGLPGVRISVAPQAREGAGAPQARAGAKSVGQVTIRGLHDDGWLGPVDGAALVRVVGGAAQILITVTVLPEGVDRRQQQDRAQGIH